MRDGDAEITGFRAYTAAGRELNIESVKIVGETVVITVENGTPAKITYAFDVSSTKRQVSYESLVKNDGFAVQYISVMTGNLENGKNQPAIPFLASVSDSSIYDVEVSKDGKTASIEIRELGHLEVDHKVVVDCYKGTTKLSSKELTASFATAGNTILTVDIASGATGVKVTLYEGDSTIDMRSTDVK